MTGAAPTLSARAFAIRTSALVAGAAVALPVVLLVGIGLVSHISPYGVVFLLAMLVLVGGLVTARWRVRRWRGLVRGSLAAMALIVGLRCAAVRGEGPMRIITLDGAGQVSTRRVNKVVPERDLALSGSRLLESGRGVPRGFVRQLAAVYDRLNAEVGPFASPLPATYLGLQRPSAFDVVIVDPLNNVVRRSDTAAVFLHGYAGNVAAICWLVSRALAEQGLLTYCPSVGFDGDWWAPHGARTLEATLRYMRGHGVRRVVLLGLSNGARGASELAPKFERQLVGLALLSGLSRRARPAGLPTLLLHGRDDPAVPPGVAARYVALAGGRARQITMPGDHFVLVTREDQFRRALARWLRQQLVNR